MGLTLSNGGPVAFDTSVFIYYIEENLRFLPVVEPLFQAASAGTAQIVTSAITLLELLVLPFQKGDTRLAAKYEDLLTRSRGIRLVDLDYSQLRAAAYLRASHRIRTMDAMQLSAALASGCTTFVTNDLKIPAIPGLSVVQLTELA